MIQRRFTKRMEEGSELAQPIWTVCLEKIVRCTASAGTEEQRNNNVTTLLNRFSKALG